MTTNLMTVHGGCHCGQIRFEADIPQMPTVYHCNCSICRMTGFEHLIVSAAHFRLSKGAQSLNTYTFNTGTAKHLFCQYCGIKSFYVPRSHPDGFSIHLQCLDEIPEHKIQAFDGQDWEAAQARLE